MPLPEEAHRAEGWVFRLPPLAREARRREIYPEAWPHNPITLHTIAYGIPAHPQQPRRSGHIAPALHQCLPNLHRLRSPRFFWAAS